MDNFIYKVLPALSLAGSFAVAIFFSAHAGVSLGIVSAVLLVAFNMIDARKALFSEELLKVASENSVLSVSVEKMERFVEEQKVFNAQVQQAIDSLRTSIHIKNIL